MSCNHKYVSIVSNNWTFESCVFCRSYKLVDMLDNRKHGITDKGSDRLALVTKLEQDPKTKNLTLRRKAKLSGLNHPQSYKYWQAKFLKGSKNG